jgi:hypothetical protein
MVTFIKFYDQLMNEFNYFLIRFFILNSYYYFIYFDLKNL